MRAADEAFNAGVTALATIAQATADALRSRLTERPTRFSYAIEALDASVEAADTLLLPPERSEPVESCAPAPRPPTPATARAEAA